ncbi:MAG TPA: hypothetical protein PK788_13305 [Gemmatimonadaceae bacterium]|nr:hypothetical protein [Gemmatimonadaceae bacterium]
MRGSAARASISSLETNGWRAVGEDVLDLPHAQPFVDHDGDCALGVGGEDRGGRRRPAIEEDGDAVPALEAARAVRRDEAGGQRLQLGVAAASVRSGRILDGKMVRPACGG